jgi:hypothetical protein
MIIVTIGMIVIHVLQDLEDLKAQEVLWVYVVQQVRKEFKVNTAQ